MKKKEGEKEKKRDFAALFNYDNRIEDIIYNYYFNQQSSFFNSDSIEFYDINRVSSRFLIIELSSKLKLYSRCSLNFQKENILYRFLSNLRNIDVFIVHWFLCTIILNQKFISRNFVKSF